MPTINFNNVEKLTKSLNDELTARGLTCAVKHVNDDEVVIQWHIQPGVPCMANAHWVMMQNRRLDGITCTLDEIDDALYGVLEGWKLQPVPKKYTINHEAGTYTLPLEPLQPRELPKPERTDLQQQFEVECAVAFPDYFEFNLWPNGQYANELTRHTFAGYELAHKNMVKTND
jgi:hypothetical protein